MSEKRTENTTILIEPGKKQGIHFVDDLDGIKAILKEEQRSK